ncbi:hypothetical protein F2Q69_00019809 [Brassica cretica]|uniref:Uncharacterized protein n=1 Tax=Brassica cretica TaxID=69181 RepID=A0A8S9QJL5_BRACR|nr:hypothetical protein F2Q69_00019809 [Brassica cretica]
MGKESKKSFNFSTWVSDLPLDFLLMNKDGSATGFTDLGLIYMFFRSGSDFGRLIGSLLGSLLKYNALENFQTTSKKSSRRLSGSFPDDFQEVF